MKIPFKKEIGRRVAAFCLGFVSIQNYATQYVEISAEIETFGYRLADTNSIAKAKPKTVHVVCITGPGRTVHPGRFPRAAKVVVRWHKHSYQNVATLWVDCR